MFKKQHLIMAIAATLAAGSTQAKLETSITLKNETSAMVHDGMRTGEATSLTDNSGKGKGVYKFENTAKILMNDQLENGTAFHGEFNIVYDGEATDSLNGYERNTQRDYVRELYVDTKLGDWDVRLGKQQVVWGTADGIKLLDMINPTDWTEFNQNTMADARVPVWMGTAERYMDDGGNVQAIVSLSQSSKFAGFLEDNAERSRSGAFNGGAAAQDNSQLKGVDAGAPFIFKGMDTITGGVNGFFNIAPAFGGVAATFSALGGGGLSGFTTATVDDFARDNPHAPAAQAGSAAFTGACNGVTSPLGNAGTYGNGKNTSAYCLDALTQLTNQNVTNSIDTQLAVTSGAGATWDTSNPNSAMEYVYLTPFATFDSFVNMKSKWVDKTQDNSDANFALRYRNTTPSGVNYSFNYAYAYDSNPHVNLSWQASDGSTDLTPEISSTNSMVLKDASGTQRCSADGANSSTAETGCYLVFTAENGRNHNIGGSFDAALDFGERSYVLRGEALYQNDVYTPVIDRGEMAIGNITEALKSEKADFLKYVVGLDTTVATDMMVSGQFIQFRNLDFVDTNSSRVSTLGKYTGDMTTLHLDNNLKKAEENKEFYSLFLSKPFGASGEGRWNNIFIYEEGGGKWNRFDVEYSINDQLIGSIEYNKYFGDNNTMFGQFENASNVQIGMKYLLQ